MKLMKFGTQFSYKEKFKHCCLIDLITLHRTSKISSVMLMISSFRMSCAKFVFSPTLCNTILVPLEAVMYTLQFTFNSNLIILSNINLN